MPFQLADLPAGRNVPESHRVVDPRAGGQRPPVGREGQWAECVIECNAYGFAGQTPDVYFADPSVVQANSAPSACGEQRTLGAEGKRVDGPPVAGEGRPLLARR